jgi:hypothetical protein
MVLYDESSGITKFWLRLRYPKDKWIGLHSLNQMLVLHACLHVVFLLKQKQA